jgi:hypothetical protein
MDKFKESDFTYESFQISLKGFEKLLDNFKYSEDGMSKASLDWAVTNIAMPNGVLVAKGYGLITQRDLLKEKLENSILKKASNEVISNLKLDLKRVENNLNEFFDKNCWID